MLIGVGATEVGSCTVWVEMSQEGYGDVTRAGDTIRQDDTKITLYIVLALEG